MPLKSVYKPVLLLVSLFLIANINSGTDTDPERKSIITAAENFLNSFSKENLERIKFSFEEEERYDWHYVPRGREGIPVKELDDGQKELLKTLLNSSLSRQGVSKTEGVITLESVLNELSGRSSYRDPGKYYITFFGTPDKIKPWGWRYEGHHLSLNFTVLQDSVIISTPMFFGANPSEVKQGKYKQLRVLKNEEDYARELIKSFDAQQFEVALIDKEAPGDIITGNAERINPLDPKGIPVSKLSKGQVEILFKLVRTYIENSHPDFAEQRVLDLKNSGEIYFAWAGGVEKGQPHYYRIQSNTFLIEYDNTQNNASHIHSVWRSFNNDFGEDLLKNHYKEYH